MRQTARFVIAVLATVATTTPAIAQSAKDSAGIRVVDNTRPAWTANRSWIISAQPVVDIGSGDDSLYQLATVMGAVRLGDGVLLPP
jgi:hypothetical protein